MFCFSWEVAVSLVGLWRAWVPLGGFVSQWLWGFIKHWGWAVTLYCDYSWAHKHSPVHHFGKKGLWEAVPFLRQCRGSGTGVSHTEQRLGHLLLSQSVPLAPLWHQLFRENECGREHRRRAERGVWLLNKGCVRHSRKICIFCTLSWCGRVWSTLVLSPSFKSVIGQVQELIAT